MFIVGVIDFWVRGGVVVNKENFEGKEVMVVIEGVIEVVWRMRDGGRR